MRLRRPKEDGQGVITSTKLKPRFSSASLMELRSDRTCIAVHRAT